jgi:hypothetical protein
MMVLMVVLILMYKECLKLNLLLHKDQQIMKRVKEYILNHLRLAVVKLKLVVVFNK